MSDRRRERVLAPAVALGDRGVLHVGYFDLGRDAVDYRGLAGPVWDGRWEVVVATSTNGGRSFTAGATVASVVPVERVMLPFTMAPPALAADRHGRVCVAWTDGRHGDADVFARCAGRGVRSGWGGAKRVNDDAVGNGAWQYLPALAISPGGRLDATFLDRRGDPQNVRAVASYTFSTDQAETFAHNLQLSSDTFDSRIGVRYATPAAQGLVEFGSRLGLLAQRDRALAAWPDTRNARMGTTEQDLFVAHVRTPAPKRSSPILRLLGAALGGGAVVALVQARRRRRPRP